MKFLDSCKKVKTNKVSYRYPKYFLENILQCPCILQNGRSCTYNVTEMFTVLEVVPYMGPEIIILANLSSLDIIG